MTYWLMLEVVDQGWWSWMILKDAPRKEVGLWWLCWWGLTLVLLIWHA